LLCLNIIRKQILNFPLIFDNSTFQPSTSSLSVHSILKRNNLNISFSSIYENQRKRISGNSFSGFLSPRDVITFEETESREYTLQCYRNENLIHELDIMIIDDTFNIIFFYANLFNLIQLIPLISQPAYGMVYASDEVTVSGNLEEL